MNTVVHNLRHPAHLAKHPSGIAFSGSDLTSR